MINKDCLNKIDIMSLINKLGMLMDNFCIYGLQYLHKDQRHMLWHIFLVIQKQSMVEDILQRISYWYQVDIQILQEGKKEYKSSFDYFHKNLQDIVRHIAMLKDHHKAFLYQDILRHISLLYYQHKNYPDIFKHT